MYPDAAEMSRLVALRREQIIGFLQELIAIPTPNPPGENYGSIAGLLRTHFQQAGVPMEATQIPEEVLSASGIDAAFPRPALRGRIGSPAGRSLHLHGHFDVVPAADPSQYRPRREDGRIWGRGAADMKSGLAAIWGALLLLHEHGLEPARPVTISLTPDEESGGETGIGELLRQGWVNAEEIEFLIMPECTWPNVWNASKGALVVDVVVEGKAAHGTLPHLGRNAFEDMLVAGKALVDLRRKIEGRESACPVEDPLAARSTMAIGGEGGGGEKFNIIPGRWHFTVDRRPIPEEKMVDVRAELFALRDRLNDVGVNCHFDEWLQADPSYTSPDHPGCRALARSMVEVGAGKPRFLLCPGFLDIRHFNARGVPAVACGPGRLEVAHGPSEWVAEQEVLDFTAALALTLLCYGQ